MPTRTEAIEAFLNHKTHNDLANLYNYNMEVQVNVAQDGGERIDGDFKGRKWHGWSDGITTWKSFRVPFKANTEPEYTDSVINFDLAEHAEGIGMTGWDWNAQVSKWVAYDFDAIVGHSDKHLSKLTHDELETVKQAAMDIDWVTIRKSTSGKGLHIYVLVDDIPTKNHNEHAALARSILGKMSALAGYDFNSRVDICGGNMWVWHRKMQDSDEGLKLIKQGTVLKDIPPNWIDHVQVITGRRRKNLPQKIPESNADLFEELTGQRPTINLDDEHKRLIDYLKDHDALWWWDTDHHMLITHTIYLKEAHRDLGYKGFFDTNAKGTERGTDHNVFLFPMRRGAWGVRRYSPGVQEHDSWDQDGAGWTRTFLNKRPTLKDAAKAFEGIEDPSGGFVFREAEVAGKAAQLLGVELKVGTPMAGRKTKLRQHKDGRLIAEVIHDSMDNATDMPRWYHKGKNWTRIYDKKITDSHESDVANYDDMVRHLITESREDAGWMVKSEDEWQREPLTHIKSVLAYMNVGHKEINEIIGSSVSKAWRLVNKPFQPEYPGGREWNRAAAQFRFRPSQKTEGLKYDSWHRVLEHCGSSLDTVIKEHSWCKANGILNGAEYLKCWIASLFQEPTEPLPYIFFYGPENSGKSIFHEALSLLLTKGYERADSALTSQGNFNGELEGAIICYVEETDLKKNHIAYNRIKDWVTSKLLSIHYKGKTPYSVPNTTHWIQCANNHQACPIFPGDTRITMCYVGAIDPIMLIPKKRFLPMLEQEAPDFLADILRLELPESNDRLNIPVIETEEKYIAQQLNQTALESFIQEKCELTNGYMILYSEFYDKFMEWIDPNEAHRWTKIRIGKELPPQFPRARIRGSGQFHIGNLRWATEDAVEVKARLVTKNGYLE